MEWIYYLLPAAVAFHLLPEGTERKWSLRMQRGTSVQIDYIVLLLMAASILKIEASGLALKPLAVP